MFLHQHPSLPLDPDRAPETVSHSLVGGVLLYVACAAGVGCAACIVTTSQRPRGVLPLHASSTQLCSWPCGLCCTTRRASLSLFQSSAALSRRFGVAFIDFTLLGQAQRHWAAATRCAAYCAAVMMTCLPLPPSLCTRLPPSLCTRLPPS